MTLRWIPLLLLLIPSAGCPSAPGPFDAAGLDAMFVHTPFAEHRLFGCAPSLPLSLYGETENYVLAPPGTYDRPEADAWFEFSDGTSTEGSRLQFADDGSLVYSYPSREVLRRVRRATIHRLEGGWSQTVLFPEGRIATLRDVEVRCEAGRCAVEGTLDPSPAAVVIGAVTADRRSDAHDWAAGPMWDGLRIRMEVEAASPRDLMLALLHPDGSASCFAIDELR